MFKGITSLFPERKGNGYHRVWPLWITGWLDKVGAEPAAAWRVVASNQSNVDHQSQAAYIIHGQVQVTLIHMHDILDGIGMHAGGDVVSLSGQGQVTARD